MAGVAAKASERVSELTSKFNIETSRSRKLTSDLRTKCTELTTALDAALPGSDGTVTVEQHRTVVKRLETLRRAVHLTPIEHQKLLAEFRGDASTRGALVQYLDPDSTIPKTAVDKVKEAYRLALSRDGATKPVGQHRLDGYVKHVLTAMEEVVVNPYHQLQLLGALHQHFTGHGIAEAVADGVSRL